jgi:hypothetical protein
MLGRLFRAPATPCTAVLSALGILLMAVAGMLFALWPALPRVDILPTSARFPAWERFIRLDTDANLTIIPEWIPAKTNEGAFIIKATIRLEEQSLPKETVSSVRNTISSMIKRQELAFTLSIAGATISPSGENPVSAGGQALWSVRIEQPGTYEGFIRPKFSPYLCW